MKHNIQSMVDPIVNFGKVIVSTGYSNLDTVIVLEIDNGSKLPNPSIDGSFNLIWWNSTDYSDPSDDPYVEIVRVTDLDGDILIIERPQEGTTQTAKNLPGKTYKMILSFTKKAFTDIRKIPDYYSKIPDIPQFQTWMKNRIGHLPDVTITGASGEMSCNAMTFDGTYIWAGLDSNPAKILKINPVDNTYTVITCVNGEGYCEALTFDGTYIWAGLSVSPFKILKINPVDNSYTVITGVEGERYCQALTFDGTYIWAGLYQHPTKILKINPVDNTYTVITGVAGEGWCDALIFDGTYIWAGLNQSPVFKILKINPADNTYTVITGATGEMYCGTLTFDGTYIWAGLGTLPFKLLKLNPVDNTYTVINGASGEDKLNGLTFDGTYVWGALDLSPTKILKVNPVDNTYIVINGASEENRQFDSMTFDGTYVWIGCYSNPVKILKKFAHNRRLEPYPKGIRNAGILTITSGATILDDRYDTILANASGGDITINLPTAVGITGRVYNIKKTDSSVNIITIDADGTETIDDYLTKIITIQYETVTVQSNGTNWVII